MKRFFLCTLLFAAALAVNCTEDEPILFGDIYGTVTNSQTGEPVRNAQVVLSPSGASTISGSDGRFEFRSLDVGQYSISVSSDGYESNSRQVTVVPGQSTSCDIHLIPQAIVEIFNIDPLTLNFGTTQTQLAVTVTNDSPNETQWSLDLGQNTWLKASPIAGHLGAGKKQTIVFSANRANLTQETSGIVTLSALGGSSSLTVNCSPSQQASSIMEVTPLDIDFGDNSTEQIVRIKNKSNALLNWTIFGIKEDAISVSDTSGSIQSGNAKVVAVKLDRSKIEGNHLTTSFMISDGTVEQQINVNVGSHESSTSDNPDEPIDKPMGKLELPSSVLDFGTDYGRLPMTINNVGDAMLEWSIVDVQDDIFSFSPESGTLEAGNSAEIQVSIDRENLPAGTAESVFAISDGINKYVVTVKYEEPEYTDGKIQLSTNTVDFGSEETLLFFEVKNVGTTYLSWTASDIPEYITFNYGYLTCKQGQNSTMNNRVELNRETMPDEVDVVITITNDFNSEDTHQVRITASKENTTTTADSKIYYTSTDGNVVNLSGVVIKSNVYEDGQGVITFSGEINTIGAYWFKSETLASISIPEGVTSIDQYAFWYCTNLASVDLPTTITNIGEGAFYQCQSLTSFTIPDGVTTIGKNAFQYCNLSSIDIPSSITTIGEGAFLNNSNLSKVNITDVSAWCNIDFETYDTNPLYLASNLYINNTLVPDLVIPDGVTVIKKYAFSNCRTIRSITLPYGVTEIAGRAFYSCDNLMNVTLNEGLITIGSNAFAYCENLTKINIPSSVREIQDAAFGGCTALSQVNITDINAWCKINFERSKYSVHYDTNPVYWSKNLYLNGAPVENVVISPEITSISTMAFMNVQSLKSIQLPESVTSIGANAFDGCVNLESCNIPNGVTTLEYEIFDGCTNLKSINIPNGVTSIGEAAFRRCSSLTGISIPSNVTSIGRVAFQSCSGLTGDITIPSGVTTIESGTFSGCEDLQNISIPNTVSKIESSAFASCSSLTTINIPEGITTLAEALFQNCVSLTEITVPSTVESIGSQVFLGCGITKYYLKPIFPPSIETYMAFDSSDRTFYVPTESVNSYKAHSDWSSYADKIVGYDFE